MEHIDLIDRILPAPSHTLAVETPKGEIVLVSTERAPKAGDTVLADDVFTAYQPPLPVVGVAYCVIRFI